MVAINTELATGVRSFLEGGDRGFLQKLRDMDRNAIEGQAVVRYLMQLKHWPFTPESDFAGILTHLFGAFPERAKITPEEYQASTFDLIKNTFDYECIVVVPEPKAEAKPNPGKVTRRPKMVKEADTEGGSQETGAGESGSRTFKSLAKSDIDTTGASDHLKKTIAIQRGS